MTIVIHQHKIGAEADQKEFEVQWDLTKNPPSASLKCCSFYRVAYAVIAGPDDILETYSNDIRVCIRVVSDAIGIDKIMRDPIAASKTLREGALANCLGHTIGDDYAKLSIAVSISVETGDWQAC